MSLAATHAAPALRPRARAAARGLALALGGTLAGLVVGVLMVAIVATRVFGYEVLTVKSGSMAPAIEAGDLIVVKPAAMKDVHEGDVILFAAGGEGVPTVHRVAGVNEVELRIADPASRTTESHTSYRLVTKGDANPEPDRGEVTEGDFKGELWFTVPGGGALTGMALQQLLIGLALASLLAWGGWELWTRRKRS